MCIIWPRSEVPTPDLVYHQCMNLLLSVSFQPSLLFHIMSLYYYYLFIGWVPSFYCFNFLKNIILLKDKADIKKTTYTKHTV